MIRLEDVLKMSWRRLENVLKKSWRTMAKTNMLVLMKASWRRMSKTNIFVFIKTSWRRLHQDECLLGNISFYYTRPMLNTTFYSVCNNKRIFHAFLFNTRNYSPEVINIQWRERSWILYYWGWIISTLNKKRMKYLFYYMPQTPNKIWEVKG